MNIALRNLIEGPGQTRAVLAERFSRLRQMPQCDPYDLNSIHGCLLRPGVGGYGGIDPVIMQSVMSLLLLNDPQFTVLRGRHMTSSPEAA